MPKIIVNLTLPLINEEIDNVFYRHLNYFYQKNCCLDDLRQDLIAYVLSRVPSSYIAVKEGQKTLIKYNSFYQSLEKRLHIEKVIYQGLYDILEQNDKWIKQENFEEISLVSPATNWFS